MTDTNLPANCRPNYEAGADAVGKAAEAMAEIEVLDLKWDGVSEYCRVRDEIEARNAAFAYFIFGGHIPL